MMMRGCGQIWGGRFERSLLGLGLLLLLLLGLDPRLAVLRRLLLGLRLGLGLLLLCKPTYGVGAGLVWGEKGAKQCREVQGGRG